MRTATKLAHRWSTVLAAAAGSLTLAVAGCGGSSNATHAASARSGAPAGQGASPPSAAARSRAPAGIPQNNGGDQDADNNGGPSDGDGSI